jgi:hypothetical protein
MQRPEVYDRHAAVPFQKELEEAARSRETSVDKLLEQIVREWLERAARHEAESEEDLQQRIREAAAPFIGAIHGGGGSPEDERQRQMRAATMKLAGVIEGDDPHRAENAGATVRAHLVRKYGR